MYTTVGPGVAEAQREHLLEKQMARIEIICEKRVKFTLNQTDQKGIAIVLKVSTLTKIVRPLFAKFSHRPLQTTYLCVHCV